MRLWEIVKGMDMRTIKKGDKFLAKGLPFKMVLEYDGDSLVYGECFGRDNRDIVELDNGVIKIFYEPMPNLIVKSMSKKSTKMDTVKYTHESFQSVKYLWEDIAEITLVSGKGLNGDKFCLIKQGVRDKVWVSEGDYIVNENGVLRKYSEEYFLKHFNEED